MKNIKAYKVSKNAVNIHQTVIKRDWMDDTVNKHAYRCHPVSMANTVGWSLSYDMDVSFIWDGILDTTPDHVTVLQGKSVCWTGRGNGTISFETGIIFKTDPDVTLLSITPPNYFIDGAQAFTSVISTSFFRGTFPCAWRITKADTVITIKAGTPIATIIPISLRGLSETEVSVYGKEQYSKDGMKPLSSDYFKEFNNRVKDGKWPGFYRAATDHEGNALGEHEVSSLRLRVNDYTDTELLG